MRQPDFETVHGIETYKGLIQLGTFGLKFVQLVNGGGAVALLAYLGNVSASGHAAPDLTRSMALFLSGLVLGGFAALTAYLMQLRLYGEGLGDERKGGHILL